MAVRMQDITYEIGIGMLRFAKAESDGRQIGRRCQGVQQGAQTLKRVVGQGVKARVDNITRGADLVTQMGNTALCCQGAVACSWSLIWSQIGVRKRINSRIAG